jgi:phenylacetate-CoA ligase
MPQRVLNLARMLRAERLSRGRLEEVQTARLRRLLAHAYARTSGYRDLWRRRGVHPADIRHLEDLQKLPVVDKSTIRDAGPENFIDCRYPAGRGLLRRYTSGSSGTPFEFFVSRSHNKWRKAQRLRPYVSNGLRPRHRILTLTSSEETPELLSATLGLFAERRVSATRPAHEMLQELVRQRPDALVGYPSALNLLADACLESGNDCPRPALLFSDSEVLTPGVRAHLREAFGTEPIDVYGSYETDNIAFQCSARKGLHVAMESAIVEIVHDGRDAQPGSHGEVVVTVLHNHAMPLIRYNLHDISAYDDAPCPCGRTLATLSAVQGRSDDYVELPDGGRRPAMPMLLEFDALAPWLREYRIVQRGVERFDVYLRQSADWTAATTRVQAIVERHLPHARLSLIECRDGIPRDPSGKLRCFVRDMNE